jgi:hypothetical protein
MTPATINIVTAEQDAGLAEPVTVTQSVTTARQNSLFF